MLLAKTRWPAPLASARRSTLAVPATLVARMSSPARLRLAPRWTTASQGARRPGGGRAPAEVSDPTPGDEKLTRQASGLLARRGCRWPSDWSGRADGGRRSPPRAPGLFGPPASGRIGREGLRPSERVDGE